jgi:SAM-dependent methyltransferase
MSGNFDSMERIVPDALEAGDATGQATLALHLERYRWAAARLPDGATLDVACGVGYGSVLLAERSKTASVAAGDLAAEALSVARRQFSHPRVHYVRGSGSGWARSSRFVAIVSLETIEHVPDPQGFLRELVEKLAPGGVLVASVPVTPSVDANPHHLTDFSRRSLLALGARCGLVPFDELRQRQPYAPIRILARTERRAQDLRPHLFRYYLSHPGSAWRRMVATLRHGFANHYLTVAWRKAAPG